MPLATEIPVAGGGTTCSRTFVTSIGWMQKLAKHAAVPPVTYGRSAFAVPFSDITRTRAQQAGRQAPPGSGERAARRRANSSSASTQHDDGPTPARRPRSRYRTNAD